MEHHGSALVWCITVLTQTYLERSTWLRPRRVSQSSRNLDRAPTRGFHTRLLTLFLEGFTGESGRPTDEAKKMMSMIKSRRNQVLDRFKKKGLS